MRHYCLLAQIFFIFLLSSDDFKTTPHLIQNAKRHNFIYVYNHLLLFDNVYYVYAAFLISKSCRLRSDNLVSKDII